MVWQVKTQTHLKMPSFCGSAVLAMAESGANLSLMTSSRLKVLVARLV